MPAAFRKLDAVAVHAARLGRCGRLSPLAPFPEHRRTLTGHTKWVFRVAFSPDGRLLASCGADNTVRLWDPAAGEHRRTLTGHTNQVFGVAFGRTAAAAART